MSREGPLLLVRADGGVGLGAGHVLRCLALAQAWIEAGGGVLFVSRDAPPWLRERLAAERVDLEDPGAEAASEQDAARTAGLAAECAATWIVLDGYRFDRVFHERISQGRSRLLVIDDQGRLESYRADALLNQNLHAEPALYARAVPGGMPLWLGPRFALLRREFWDREDERVEPPVRAARLLVSLGGAGVEALVERALSALAPLAARGVEIVLLTGARETVATAAGVTSEERATKTTTTPGIRLETDVRDMASRMAAADFAVAAAGGTAWELARMGVPAVLLSIADNQRPVARSLAEAGAAVDAGDFHGLAPERLRATVQRLVDDAERRTRMAARGRALVDGQGARRVVMRMRGDRLRLRPARPADARLLWRWVNEPGARASAFSSAPIAWEQHVGWFAERLADVDTRIFVALDADDAAVGQIRFEFDGDEAEVDVSVDRERRGRGEGAALIALGTERLFRISPVRRVHAWVRPGNAASVAAFERAGYAHAGGGRRHGQDALHLVRERLP